MLIDFFYHLRAHKLPVSVKEYLTLVDALRHDLMAPTLDEFYFLARATLVKDESLYDRYDKAFGAYYKGIEAALPPGKEIPLDWLIKQFEKNLTPEEKAAIEKHGWDKLMELFKERMQEQKERHAGGSKWIGTGGTSPFGNGGYHRGHSRGRRVGGQPVGRQGLGHAPVQGLRRPGRTGHAQLQGGATALAPLRAPRRRNGTGPG